MGIKYKMNLFEALNKSDYKSQLTMGIKIESEHRDLYEYIQSKLKEKNVEMPISEKEFYTKIAERHLEEKSNYYTLLKKYIESDEL